ncbi:hypothetical protein [Reyranella sp.]|uniref:hypothetical protein n=1 Tax=Reyranella sp. TaxID=1929291 RepID=UPI003BAA6074
MHTLTTLGSVQAARTAAFPAKFADNPLRAITLDSLQRRNAILDAVFYDIGVITPEETKGLAFWLAREGAILFVTPSGQEPLQLFLTTDEFFSKNDKAAAALVVAGVGSSALGAAAFARNVADALGEPVVAVVSGYGLADVLTEAMGGFFLFGGLNSLRHLFEPLDMLSKTFTWTERWSELDKGARWARSSKDTETVIALLKDQRFGAPLLVGHSKGNLVLSEALYAIAGEDEALAGAMGKKLRIVTISAKIGMPPHFPNVLDVMGAWDWFGALNSRPDIPAEYTVPRAWHSTNRDFPMGMAIDVKDALLKVLPMFGNQRQARPSTEVAAIFDAPQRMAAALRSPVA